MYGPFVRPYTAVCLRLYCACTVYCNTRSIPSHCLRYSDKLPMKITCNCWNNLLWNHLSTKPGYTKMSLEFPGVISLQIQVTTKEFESWIHYWTIPLNSTLLCFCYHHLKYNSRLVSLCFYRQLNRHRLTRCSHFSRPVIDSTKRFPLSNRSNHQNNIFLFLLFLYFSVMRNW